MTEQNKYSTTPRDYTHVGPVPQTIATGKALGKVDPTSQLLARDIRNFAWAEDTQESIARFIEWCSILYSFTEERNDIIDFTVDQLNRTFSDALNEFSELRPRAEMSITRSTEALTRSQYALNVANGIDSKATNAMHLSQSADTLSKSVQEQFNQMVIDGDSSPAADQARVDDKGYTHSSLKGRIDSSDLAKYRIKNGRIKLPTGFPQLPFDIFKVGDWNYTHNATPQNQHDWSTATEVFIAGLGAVPEGSGTSADSPITLETFYANVRADVYGEQDDFILSMINTYYTIHTSLNLGQLQKNIYMRSVSLKGKTYMNQFSFQGTSGVSEPWSEDGNIFKTTVNSSADTFPINVGDGEDEFGISNPHIPVSSVSEVRDKVGAYYYDYQNRTMYLHPYPSESINDVEIAWKPSNSVLEVSNTANNVLMFENLHFMNGSYRFTPSTTETKLYFFGCNFYRGPQDAFGITGKFTVYLFDCVGAYPNKDAFNYHTSDSNSLAVEINTRGYGSGQYKYINQGNQGRGSNNGSTAHDGMHMLRVGGEYWDCEGPVIADVGNCYSISIGCRTFDILPTTATSLMTGFYVETPSGVTLEDEKPKYFIECEQHGKYFTQGVRGVGSNKTYVQAVNVDIGEGHLINWEDVV